MRAVIKRPGFHPVEVILPGDSLKAMQKVVGGYICTAFRLPSHDDGYWVDVYCNDEGLLRDMPLNIISPVTGEPLVGSVIAVRSDPEGETVDLTDLEVRAMLRVLRASSICDDMVEGD